jgi:protein associated with RNAse G/E
MKGPTRPCIIRVVSCKYDGSPRDEWPAQLLEHEGTRLRLHAMAGSEEIVEGSRRRLITDSFRAFYWTDRWYNVAQFGRSEGIVLYANIAMPCSFDGSVLRWVDLDTDVVQYADGTIEVRDEAEFRERSARLRYPDEVVQSALAARDEVLRLLQSGQFPEKWGQFPFSEESSSTRGDRA